jgi:hypothetical protein
METLSQPWYKYSTPVRSPPNYSLYTRDSTSDNSDPETIRFPWAKETVARQDEAHSQVLVPQLIRRSTLFGFNTVLDLPSLFTAAHKIQGISSSIDLVFRRTLMFDQGNLLVCFSSCGQSSRLPTTQNASDQLDESEHFHT